MSVWRTVRPRNCGVSLLPQMGRVTELLSEQNADQDVQVNMVKYLREAFKKKNDETYGKFHM